MGEQNSKANVKRCSVLIASQGVTTQAASNPTKAIAQFPGSDATLLRRGSDDTNLGYLLTYLG